MPATRSGLAGQVGFGVEATPGTAVAPTFYLPITDESIANEVAPSESGAILAGRATRDTSSRIPGLTTIGGDIGLELTSTGLEVILEHMMGKVVKTGTAPTITRVYTPGDHAGKALTVQVGRPTTAGTVAAFNYAGAKVASWEMSGSAGEIVTLGLTMLAMTETIDTPALGTPAYTSPIPVGFNSATLSLGGSQICVSEWSLSGENSLADDRRCTAQTGIKEPLQNDLREYSGSLTGEFESLTHYQNYLDGDDLTLSIACAVGAATLTITSKVILDGTTPAIADRGIIEAELPFTCVGATDAEALTITLVNAVV